MAGKDKKGVRYTEREYCMEVSMQTLVKKNQEQLIEIARGDGNNALLQEKLKLAEANVQKLEWAVKFYKAHASDQGIELPPVPPIPVEGEYIETIDLPPTQEREDPLPKNKRNGKDAE